MSDHQVDMPTGWKGEWTARTLMPLTCYLSAVGYLISFTIIGFGLACFLFARRSIVALKQNQTNSAEISAKLHKKVLKCTRAQFFGAVVSFAHVFVLVLVDAYIAAVGLKDDISTGLDDEESKPELIVAIALICGSLLVMFMASFFVVPLLQMLLVTWVLSRFSKKHGSNALADYIPEARFISTHMAQIWCTLAFMISAFWAPRSEPTLWRYALLQACIGSSTAWLDASYAFNFCYDRLETIEIGGKRTKDILRMFGQTAKVVHAKQPMDEKLPRYEDNPREGVANKKH